MGMLGLLEACRRFDASRGDSFTAYASQWIRHGIASRLKVEQPMIRIPDKWPINRRISVVSLNAPTPCGGTCELGDMVSDDAPPDSTLCAREDRERVHAALARLTPRDAQVLRLRYGMRSDDAPGYPMTLEEIARLLRVTRERVRQIEMRARERIRRRLRRAN